MLIRTFVKIPAVDGAHWYLYAMVQLWLTIPLLYFGYKRRNIYLVLLGLLIAFYLFLSHTIASSKLFLLCFFGGMSLTLANKKIALSIYSLCGVFVAIWSKCPYVLIIFGVVPFVVFDVKLVKSIISVLFCNPIIVFVGAYSYMWYLIHQQLGYSIIHALKELGLNDYIVIVSTILFTFFLSVVLHKLAEKIAAYKYNKS